MCIGITDWEDRLRPMLAANSGTINYHPERAEVMEHVYWWYSGSRNRDMFPCGARREFFFCHLLPCCSFVWFFGARNQGFNLDGHFYYTSLRLTHFFFSILELAKLRILYSLRWEVYLARYLKKKIPIYM